MKKQVAKINKSILRTKEDWDGFEILKMSNFLMTYTGQLSSGVETNFNKEYLNTIPAGDIAIINDALKTMNIMAFGKNDYVLDFDKLPKDIKEKLNDGVYKVGESRQVDGNYRATIVDENGQRVKDVTIKKGEKIGLDNAFNDYLKQVQLVQLNKKVSETYELQKYQIESDRKNRIVKPFLDLRDKIKEAENSLGEEKTKRYEEANDLSKSIFNAIKVDIENTGTHLRDLASLSGLSYIINEIQSLISGANNNIDTYTRYLSEDIQFYNKLLGIYLYVCDRLKNEQAKKDAIKDYENVLAWLAINKDSCGNTITMLLQENSNRKIYKNDFWYNFQEDVKIINDQKQITIKKPMYYLSVED